MRIKIDGHEVEGSAEEVAKLIGLLSGSSSQSSGRASGPPSGGDASPFVSEDMAYDVLTRRTLGEIHVKLLQKLDAAGEAWTTAPDLQSALGVTTREFAGVLGAFGRRLSHTEGVGSRNFFDQYWDHDHGYNLYRLPPSVRGALRRAKVV